MAKYIDLSLTFDGKFGKFDKKFNIDFRKDRTYAKDGRQASSYTVSAHGHTHVDAPLHMAGPDSKTITDYPADYFIGEASLIDVPRGKNEPITGADLEAAGRHCRNDDIVIIRTGWLEKTFGKEEFTDSPYLTEDAAEWLVRLKARIAGYDFVHDYSARIFVRGGTVKTEDCIIHLILLRNGVLNLEFLNNLSQIQVPRFQIFALPIKLQDLDGAPCRPVALV